MQIAEEISKQFILIHFSVIVTLIRVWFRKFIQIVSNNLLQKTSSTLLCSNSHASSNIPYSAKLWRVLSWLGKLWAGKIWRIFPGHNFICDFCFATILLNFKRIYLFLSVPDAFASTMINDNICVFIVKSNRVFSLSLYILTVNCVLQNKTSFQLLCRA